MLEKISKFYKRGQWQKWVLPVYAIVTIITCLQRVNSDNNNFVIFRYSSLHLLAQQPLYAAYPQEYNDFFLYHPSFTVLFMPFAFLPNALAICLWTVLSTLVFLRTIYLLPGITDTAKKIILLLVLPELVNNQQYVQTNIFLTAIMLLAFIYFEKDKLFWAAFFTMLAFCIKGYGGIVGVLFILYPGKLKFIGYAAFWGIVITALPMLFISFNETVTCYTDWIKMISSDEIKESMSIIGVFGKTHLAELIITLTGFFLLMVSFAMPIRHAFLRHQYTFRALLCCYLFVWVVLFNRAAESPTYQLVITGVAFWFVLGGYSRANLYIISALFVYEYLLPSDLFPAIFHRLFREYQLKVYPFILLFLYMQYQVIRQSFRKPDLDQLLSKI